MDRHPTADEIIISVCDAFDVSPCEIMSRCRTKQCCVARSACFVLLRELTNRSYPEIARATNRTSHTTAFSSARLWFKKFSAQPGNSERLERARDLIRIKTFDNKKRCPYCLSCLTK